MILIFQQCNSIIVAGLVDIENTSTNHSILEDTLSKSGSSHPLLMSMNSATLRKSHQMFNISLLGGASPAAARLPDFFSHVLVP